MYGGSQKFSGRISGFTMGTGSTLALLPPQNATGNFVKVVQRLPVRIDLMDYDPERLPLFVGLSVTPRVHIRGTAHRPECRQVSAAADVLQPAPATNPGADFVSGIGGARTRPPYSPVDQPVAGRGRRRHSDVHGGARHDDRQRGAALHRGRTLRGRERQRMGHHQLPGGQRDRPADFRLARDAAWAVATIFCCRSRCSRSPRHCAAWRRAWRC